MKLSDFMLCAAESLLVQVTVVPAFTVSISGLKAKLSMLTLALSDVADTCETELVADDVVVLEEVVVVGDTEHDVMANTKATDMNTRRMNLFLFIANHPF